MLASGSWDKTVRVWDVFSGAGTSGGSSAARLMGMWGTLGIKQFGSEMCLVDRRHLNSSALLRFCSGDGGSRNTEETDGGATATGSSGTETLTLSCDCLAVCFDGLLLSRKALYVIDTSRCIDTGGIQTRR